MAPSQSQTEQERQERPKGQSFQRQKSMQLLDNELLKKLTSTPMRTTLNEDTKNQGMMKLFTAYKQMQLLKQKQTQEHVIFIRENSNTAFVVLTRLKGLLEEKILIHLHHGFKFFRQIAALKRAKVLALGSQSLLRRQIHNRYE